MIVVEEAVNAARQLVSMSLLPATTRGPVSAAPSAEFGPSARLVRPTPSAKISIVVLGEPA
jgi:hypothetical protein